MASELRELPNIGAVLEQDLLRAGIRSAEPLRALGCVETALRIEAATGEACCASRISALEGAIRGVRWHGIDPAERRALVEQVAETRIARTRKGG